MVIHQPAQTSGPTPQASGTPDGVARAVRDELATATVVSTDAHGLLAGMVSIPTADGAVRAYRAQPGEGAGTSPTKGLPTVLVVQEIFGVHAYIQDICRRLAHLGYQAIAVEAFQRQGDPAQLATIPEILEKIVARVPDVQVLADLDAAAAWAAANGGDPDRLGITGFCYGGRIVWLYAAERPAIRAAVAWYGRLSGRTSEITPCHPLQVAARLRVPVLGLYGGQDGSIPLGDVEAMEAQLRQSQSGKSGSQIVVYPDAPHAFHADYRPSYRQGPAEDGWRRLVAWFRDHGL